MTEHYASVPERITWTTGFRLPIDKHVLGVLSTFANFRTGKHAAPAVPTLAKRAQVPRSSLMRSLARLKQDRWVFAKQRHRRPTVYDINVDRLQKTWTEAPHVITNLSPTGETQDWRVGENLSPTGETQDRVLSPTSETQDRVLSPTGGTPSPVLAFDPLYRTDPQEPALRAESRNDSETTTPTDRETTWPARQLNLGPYDVSPTRARDPDWQVRFAATLRSVLHQAPRPPTSTDEQTEVPERRKKHGV